VTALYEIVHANRSVDYVRKLTYQQTDLLPVVFDTRELATIKFRYKKPDGERSILLSEAIPFRTQSYGQASNNFRFSAAVAGFGMLLRNSEYQGNLTYDQVLNLARGSRGTDEDGYRAEFIRLVELSRIGLTSMNNEE
jgi:Ca-activated chloride channel family protein